MKHIVSILTVVPFHITPKNSFLFCSDGLAFSFVPRCVHIYITVPAQTSHRHHRDYSLVCQHRPAHCYQTTRVMWYPVCSLPRQPSQKKRMTDTRASAQPAIPTKNAQQNLIVLSSNLTSRSFALYAPKTVMAVAMRTTEIKLKQTRRYYDVYSSILKKHIRPSNTVSRFLVSCYLQVRVS